MSTKIEQDFQSGEYGQFTETRRALVSVAIVIILIAAAIGLVVWYFLPSPATLLPSLPSDAAFYVSLALPAENRWYERPFFWRQDELPPLALPLYQKLGFINLPFAGLSFNQVLPLVRDKLELAMLPDGTWIFAASLKYNFDASILAHEFLWAKNLKDLHWVTVNRQFYLSNRADFWKKIKTRPALSLGKLNRGLGKGLASFYLKDASALPESGIGGLAAVVGAAHFPFTATAKTSGHNIVWREIGPKNRLSSPSLEKLLPVGSAANAGLVWQFADLGQIFTRAFSDVSQENKELLGKFYNVNPSGLAGKLLGKQGLFIFSDAAGPNWILLIREHNSSPDQDILSIFKGMATSFFAAAHPQTVAHTLADGSKMVELRAEPAGIEGKAFIWRWKDTDYDFWGLSGQGENTGYFAGFLPGYGYALMTSPDLLDALPSLSFDKDLSPKDQAACSPGRKTANHVWWRPSLPGFPSFLREIIKFISLNEDSSGQLSGCFVF